MNNRIWFKGIRTCNDKWAEGLPIFMQKNDCYITNGIGALPVRPETICQYIEYEDCDGWKAFEHDIVLYNKNGVDYKGEIVYRDGKYEIAWFKNHTFRSDIDFWFKNRELKIIGNRFDSKSE